MELIKQPMPDLQTNYWMVQKLGCGSFGKVYLLRHRKTHKLSVAKQQKWTGTETRRNIRNEAAILKMLKGHPNMLIFEEYYEGKGRGVILTEYLEGGELFQCISSQKYKLTEAKCREFFRQIINGVNYIHSRGVLHLDLKPENIILITPPMKRKSKSLQQQQQQKVENGKQQQQQLGVLKIIDFGLSRVLASNMESIPINMCGTIEFMPPEVMRCSHASRGSDMWSAGVLLYMMLSGGVSPFWDGSTLGTQKRVARGTYTLRHPNLETISKAAKHCIKLLLHKDDHFRPSASQILEHEWLTDQEDYVDRLKQLEMKWMRRALARRRWLRWFLIIKAMNRLKARRPSGEIDLGLTPEVVGTLSSKLAQEL